jgi:C1A family cysteine protease
MFLFVLNPERDLTMAHEEVVERLKAEAAQHGYEVGMNPVLQQVLDEARRHVVTASASGIPVSMDHAKAIAVAKVTGLRKPADFRRHIVTHRCEFGAGPVAPLPAEYDARNENIVPPIRNQKSCGQCWNFAGVGIAEINYIKNTKVDPRSVDWSEQAVVDCGQTGGCDGDWTTTSLEILKTKGTVDEKVDPYRPDSGNGRCPIGVYFVQDYGYIDGPDTIAPTEKIKAEIYAKGSANVNVYVDDGFMAYRSGVYRNPVRYKMSDGTLAVNHAVIAIGWSESRKAFLIRNHWDTTWGEGGYMWLDYNTCNVGYGATSAVAKVPQPAPGPDPKPDPKPNPEVVGMNGVIKVVDGRFISFTPDATDVKKCPCDNVHDGVGFSISDLVAKAKNLLDDADALVSKFGPSVIDALNAAKEFVDYPSAVTIVSLWNALEQFGGPMASSLKPHHEGLTFSPADLLGWAEAISALISLIQQIRHKPSA